MKKIVSIMLSLVMVLSMITAVVAEDAGVKVKFNGDIMEFDVNPIIENDRTLVPFRAIFEALGCVVNYYPTDGNAIVSAKKADDLLMLTIGEDVMFYSGEEIMLDVAPKIVDDRTLVPLRAISEAFGAKVEWDAENRTALVFANEGEQKIFAETVSDEILAEDGSKIMNVGASYPVVENTENDEFITTINDLSKEFVSGFLFADEELEPTANELYKKYGGDAVPMELYSTFTIDTNKNGLLSITNHTGTEMIETEKYYKESIVWDMKNKKQLELTDILIGDLETEINQTVYDAFLAYYEENHADIFDAAVAEKLGAELVNVRFYLTDNSLVLYFNPGQVIDSKEVQKVEIPYKESFFKIQLDEKESENVLKPLPAAIDIEAIEDCTMAVSLKKGDAYVDDNGAMQMKVMVYTYDLYDMVDVANLKAGDSFVRCGETVKIESLERNESGTVIINGGLDNDGYELYSDDDTVYYEAGYNDAKAYYELGEVTLRVSTEFVYTDESDLDNREKEYYPGDFLSDDAGIDYDFNPHNTQILVEGGMITEMTRFYQP